MAKKLDQPAEPTRYKVYLRDESHPIVEWCYSVLAVSVADARRVAREIIWTGFPAGHKVTIVKIGDGDDKVSL
jgi:hypothetical protein